MITENDIADFASVAAKILLGHAKAACSFAEAYGHCGREIVLSGDHLSPSTRAYPSAEMFWNLGEPFFEDFEERLDYFISGVAIPCNDVDGRENDPDYCWTLQWQSGNLVAVHPDHNLED